MSWYVGRHRGSLAQNPNAAADAAACALQTVKASSSVKDVLLLLHKNQILSCPVERDGAGNATPWEERYLGIIDVIRGVGLASVDGAVHPKPTHSVFCGGCVCTCRPVQWSDTCWRC